MYSLEKAIAPYSSPLAWKIPWTEEPGRPAVHGVTKGRTWLSDFTFTFHFPALEKEMATHSSVLIWRTPGMVEPGGLPSMGLHRVRHDWSELAAAAAACIPWSDKLSRTLHSCDLFSSNPYTQSSLEKKQQSNSRWGTFYKIYDQHLLQVVKVWETKNG